MNRSKFIKGTAIFLAALMILSTAAVLLQVFVN